MGKLKIIKMLCLSLVVFTAKSQDYSADAFKYSYLSNPAGSARMRAIGGEYSAIGADITNIAGNPAGLGLYTRSEFSVSTGLSNLNTSTNYINNLNQNKKNTCALKHIAMVMG